MVVGLAVYFANLLGGAVRGRPAGPNPWDASSLEWAVASPPPVYNFAYTPVVDGREPLWEAKGAFPVMGGLADYKREVLLTSVVDARPDVREGSPEPSLWPLVAAIAVTILFIASIFHEWALVWGSIPVIAAFLGWYWPKPSHSKAVEDHEGKPQADPPPGALA